MNLPERIIRQQLVSAIQIVAQVARLSDGSRRVVKISEVAGLGEETVEFQDLFEFERLGVSDTGRVLGRLRATGARPHCLERLRACGIHLRQQIFHESLEVRI
jgi:pilus assembly protein CpaF